jgi:DnaJ-class molecular chaperone
MNYYLILGINSDATSDQIKEAYRRKVKKYHPDHFGEDSSPFLKVQEAYQVLSDPVRRKKYDQTHIVTKSHEPSVRSGISGRITQNPEPLIPEQKTTRPDPISLTRSFHTYSPSFDEIFDRLLLNFGQGVRQKSEKPESITVEVKITPKEAVTGGALELLIPVRIHCPLCGGSGMVGLWECHRCATSGVIDTEIPLIVSYPGGIQNSYSKSISLNRYGIDNCYLNVNLRVSNEAD